MARSLTWFQLGINSLTTNFEHAYKVGLELVPRDYDMDTASPFRMIRKMLMLKKKKITMYKLDPSTPEPKKLASPTIINIQTVNFRKLEMATLRQYRRHFKLVEGRVIGDGSKSKYKCLLPRHRKKRDNKA